MNRRRTGRACGSRRLHTEPNRPQLPMTLPATNVAILGSTGSIGRSTLEVIAASRGRLAAVGLSAHASLDLLEQQAGAVRPKWIVATDRQAAAGRIGLVAAGRCRVARRSAEARTRPSREPDVDVVVSAIVGSAGLRSTWAALEAGKTVALANKETLVVGWPLGDAARRPDGRARSCRSTASTVPSFRPAGRAARRGAAGGADGQRGAVSHVTRRSNWPRSRPTTPCAHPTWAMGPKDYGRFGHADEQGPGDHRGPLAVRLARPTRSQVVIHPQSIVHSMVEFVDGSVIAQLSPPGHEAADPVCPDVSRAAWTGVAAKLDWSRAMQLDFEPPDFERFRRLALGMEVARAGGTAGAVLNGANEAAVAAFLAGEIGFTEIVPACRSILEQHDFDPHPTLEQLLELDPGHARRYHVGSVPDRLYRACRCLGTIVEVAVGLGFVIFVHELGHFAVAKAVRREVREVLSRLRHRRAEVLQVPLGRDRVRHRHPAAGRLRQDARPGGQPEPRSGRERAGESRRARRSKRSIPAATWPRACPAGWRSFRPAS